MSKTTRYEADQSQSKAKDWAAQARLKRQLKETEDEETIRYALTNGASAVLEREKIDADTVRR